MRSFIGRWWGIKPFEEKMSPADEYLTVKGQGNQEIKVKGSRFIAAAAPVGSEEEARAFVARVSREHFDATHNCYAYRVGHGDGAIFRFSDAGEPSGTAGRPIMEAIESRGLTDVVVVVTRYFGGTKLGTGGLARAYRESAQAVLDKVGTKREFLSCDFTLSFPYEGTKQVQRLLREYQGEVIAEKYDQEVSLTVRIRRSQGEKFRRELSVLGWGKVKIVIT
jgi:uncharacterized YigZ family protein